MEPVKIWMDGPHLTPAGVVCSGQAVLFRTWWDDRTPMHIESVGYRMGYVIALEGETVYLESLGDRLVTRLDCMYTHPDMVEETRRRKLESLDLLLGDGGLCLPEERGHLE